MTRFVALAALTAFLGASPSPSVPPENAAPRVDPVSAALARFAQTELDREFSADRNALYTSCPYALGTYSLIEISGIRRVYRIVKPDAEEEAAGITARRELTLQPKKVRYYWELGRKWIDGTTPPKLTYTADRRGDWTFSADQHLCARGEPQAKPGVSRIPPA